MVVLAFGVICGSALTFFLYFLTRLFAETERRPAAYFLEPVTYEVPPDPDKGLPPEHIEEFECENGGQTYAA